MNDIQIFKNEAFGEVRVAGTSEEPLFCLADVCKVLELGNPSQVKTRLCGEVILMRSSRTLLVDHKK
jgi:prophage antirepressor-like protein